MRTISLCMVLVALFIGGCSSGESYVRDGYDFSKVNKVAILSVSGAVRGDAAKDQIADFFAMELLKRGYAPVERAQVQTLLKEQEFQATDITSAEGAAQAGRILNVPTVLLVNIPTCKEEISMTAKMIDVEDASILWIGSGSGTTGRTISTIAGAAAGAAAGVAVSGEDDRVIGGVVGGVLGGVAGRALSPQEAKKSQEIIRKLCKSLPSRVGR